MKLNQKKYNAVIKYLEANAPSSKAQLESLVKGGNIEQASTIVEAVFERMNQADKGATKARSKAKAKTKERTSATPSTPTTVNTKKSKNTLVKEGKAIHNKTIQDADLEFQVGKALTTVGALANNSHAVAQKKVEALQNIDNMRAVADGIQEIATVKANAIISGYKKTKKSIDASISISTGEDQAQLNKMLEDLDNDLLWAKTHRRKTRGVVRRTIDWCVALVYIAPLDDMEMAKINAIQGN